jgi:hypothetical protein
VNVGDVLWLRRVVKSALETVPVRPVSYMLNTKRIFSSGVPLRERERESEGREER